MSRSVGIFDFPATLEVKAKSTLDARQIVDNFSDLLQFTQQDFIPKGFTVAVKGVQDEQEQGVYQCVDENNLQNQVSWKKIAGIGVGLQVIDSVSGYLLTATEDPNTIQGQSELMFVNNNLGIGESNPQARLEIYELGSKDLLLIKNNEDKGIKINNEGVFQLTEFETLPNVVEGGITYSENAFWVGIKNTQYL